MRKSSLPLQLALGAGLYSWAACAPPPSVGSAAPPPAPLFLTQEDFQRTFAPSADPQAFGQHVFVEYADLEGDARPEALVTMRTVESTWRGSGTGEFQNSCCLLEYRAGAFALVADSVTDLEFSSYPTGMCLGVQADSYQFAAEGESGSLRVTRRLVVGALPARDFDTEHYDFEVTLIYRQSAPGTPFVLEEPAGLVEADRNGLVKLAARRWIAGKWEVARTAAFIGTPEQQHTLRKIAFLTGEDEWAAQLKALLPPEPVPDPVALQDY